MVTPKLSAGSVTVNEGDNVSLKNGIARGMEPATVTCT
jgi:hypothetical protein